MIKKIATVSALALAFTLTASVASADTHASSTRVQFAKHHEPEIKNASTTDREIHERAMTTGSSTQDQPNLGKHLGELKNHASSTDRELHEHAMRTASSTEEHPNLGKHLGELKNHASSTAMSHGDLKKNFHAKRKGKNGHKHATSTSDR